MVLVPTTLCRQGSRPRARTATVSLAILLATLATVPLATAATRHAVDHSKSTIGFIGTQDGAPFEGKFGSFKAAIVFSPDDLPGSKFDVQVDTRSVDSGDDDRDSAIKSEDLLYVEKYPTSRFVSSGFAANGAGRFEAQGKLTIRGVARDVRLPFSFETKQEAGKPVSWLKGEFVVKRLDYGVGQGEWEDTSVAANEVTVKYALRLTPVAAPTKPTPPPAAREK